MRLRRAARNGILRGLLLTGSVLSFIPVFALVRANSVSGSSPAASPSPATTSTSGDDDRGLIPSTRGYTAPYSAPSQPQTATRPHARTRAS